MSTTSDFYVTGGNLDKDAPSYVVRQADTDLYDTLQKNEYCYVLTSRQMGKSSLMVRTAHRLRQEDTAVVLIELTGIGKNVNAEQWYDGLVVGLGRQLNLENELQAFWERHRHLGPLQRWTEALRTVVLTHCRESVVIFIDEIDMVMSLPFSADEFFAGIRQCYNARAHEPGMKGLSFCLSGVATPSDLIQDVRITPFNIGKRIELNDFTAEEAAVLALGLGRQDRQSAALLKRILYWTGGHPYLTQKLCQVIAADPTISRPAQVDRVCEDIFLSTRSRESDSNLQFVRERLLKGHDDPAAVLDLFRQIRSRKKIRDNDTDPRVNTLRLSGATRVVEKSLAVRNHIYRKAFDREWIKANMPDGEERRQKTAFQRGFIRAIAFVVLIMAIFGVGKSINWYLKAYKWEHVTYYNTFTKHYGIMQGIGQLTEQQVRGRSVSFKFFRNGSENPVHKVQAVNSTDELTPRHGAGTYLQKITASEQYSNPLRECQWEFILNKKGEIVYEKAYDKYDQLIWGLVYSPTVKGERTRAHFVGKDGYPRPQKNSAAEFVEFEYIKGYERYRRYFDRNRNPQPGLDKAFGRFQRFNERGMAIEITSLNNEDKPMNDGDGNAIQKLTYDALGNIIKAVLLNATGGPFLCIGGWYQYTAKYDDRGDPIEHTYFNKDGKPTLHKDGHHKATVKYDNKGNPIEWAYFDTDGEPILLKDVYHKTTVEYDDSGNQIKWACFDKDGKPTLSKDGCHKFTAKYDDRGHQTELTYFDTDGKPTSIINGYHKFIAKYDDKGNQTEQTYFDTDGEPILNKDGYHKLLTKYDDRGNQTEWTYFDKDGKSVLIEDGYHKLIAKYNDKSNQTEWAYFDAKGKPILLKDRYHKSTAKYDDRGNQIKLTYFDTESKPTLLKYRYHKSTAKYDDRGNQIEWAYFDTDGKRCMYNHDYHKLAVKYDDRGNKIEETCFDTKDDPIMNFGFYHYHKATYKYDGRSNPIEKKYFNTDGKPTLIRSGYHKLTAKYDQRDNRIEEAYFDKNGKPTLSLEGSHRIIVKYDDKGNKFTAKYDKLGNQTTWAYYDSKGKPTLNKDGYHKMTTLDDNSILKESMKENGFHKIITFSDDRGNSIKQVFFGTDDSNLQKDDYYKCIFKRDDRGEIIELEKAFFNKYGKPTLSKGYYHKSIDKKDDRGNTIENAFFDAEGKPTSHKEGFHKGTLKYDDRDNQIEVAVFDTEGKPTLHKDGAHKVNFKYDDDGNDIEKAYFDTNGKPILLKDGYHKYTNKYDGSGNKIERAYFDTDGKPTLHRDGYHKYTNKYDGGGNLIEKVHFDMDGQQLRTEIVVASVDEKSQAEKSGIKTGDVFTHYDGKPISDFEQLIAERNTEPKDGQPKELKVRRNGKMLSFMIAPGKIGVELTNRIIPSSSKNSEAATGSRVDKTAPAVPSARDE
ncbi:AAA-like domain-containing protein [Desulfococcaceae bacterium HSG7]|nr:AAA-like domain-containing protein [Desulfococcaceae bacterium HSG7]